MEILIRKGLGLKGHRVERLIEEGEERLVAQLDDPLAGLDEVMTGRVLDWIRAAAGRGAAVILTGQHIRSLLGTATKAMSSRGGRLTALPAGADGLEDPRVRQLLSPSLSLARRPRG